MMQKIKRKTVIMGICLIITAVLIFLCFRQSCITTGSRTSVIQTAADTSETLPQQPSVSAETAVLIECASGRVLYDKDKDKQMYPASTTKIMTALLAVESAEDAEIYETAESETEEFMKHIVTVADEAAGVEGSSIFLKKGEKITLEDLLYGMMLRSGNDAAVAVAAEIGGTADDFTAMMNERAASLGLKNTNFCNPNGLQDEAHKSTAYDLAMIAREAMQHEIFRKIVGTKVWNASREGADSYNYFYNKNKTIFQYEGATGIKIGYTTTSGRCLVASAQKNGMELIAVVLNDTNWFKDAYSLFDYGFACYNNVTVCEAEKRLTTVKVNGGSRNKVFVGTHDAVICPSPKGEKTDISVEYEIPQQTDAPVSRWQEAGSMKIFSAGEYIYAVPLYYLEDID